jgi:CO/xanthine dehydrogenase Mo-binding subunit
MALLEETDYDPRNGAPMKASLADYVVAIHADAPKMEVHLLGYPAPASMNWALARLGTGETEPA